MTGYHKECRPSEIWVGNTLRNGDVISRLAAHGLRTARLGEVAYDIDGEPIATDYMAPLLIGRSEEAAYDNYMMKRTFGPNWRRG